jgi:hypothetical protein
MNSAQDVQKAAQAGNHTDAEDSKTATPRRQLTLVARQALHGRNWQRNAKQKNTDNGAQKSATANANENASRIVPTQAHRHKHNDTPTHTDTDTDTDTDTQTQTQTRIGQALFQMTSSMGAAKGSWRLISTYALFLPWLVSEVLAFAGTAYARGSAGCGDGLR